MGRRKVYGVADLERYHPGIHLEGEGKPLKTFPRWPASGENRTRASRMRGAWANHRTTTLGVEIFLKKV